MKPEPAADPRAGRHQAICLDLLRFLFHAFRKIFLSIAFGLHDLIDPYDNIHVLAHKNSHLFWRFILYPFGNLASHADKFLGPLAAMQSYIFVQLSPNKAIIGTVS